LPLHNIAGSFDFPLVNIAASFELPLFNIAAQFDSLPYNPAGRFQVKIKELSCCYIKSSAIWLAAIYKIAGGFDSSLYNIALSHYSPLYYITESLLKIVNISANSKPNFKLLKISWHCPLSSVPFRVKYKLWSRKTQLQLIVNCTLPHPHGPSFLVCKNILSLLS
jgi:hypothetical protein